MKIIEILLESAMLLGLNDEHTLLDNAQSTITNTSTEENENSLDLEEETTEELLKNKNIKCLYKLVKYSLQELCTNYIPVISRVCKHTSEKNIPISELENYIRIQKITKNNSNVKYKILNRKICFLEDGEYEIEYQTYPTITNLFEEVDFLSKFSNDVIVCSVCAYFSLSNGMFDEFKDFYEMYIEKADNIKELKSFNLPQRRWE